MKGFTKDDKFHPIRDTKGVRKSRDQTKKTEGVKIKRKAFPMMTDKQIMKEFEPPETGGVCECKHCGNYYQDDPDVLIEHLQNCKGFLNGIRKSRDQSTNTQRIRMKRESEMIEREDVLAIAVGNTERSLKKGLDEHFKNHPKFKNAVWDVSIDYEGSHGTVDSEYFLITAYRKGVGSVEYREAFSNDDWYDMDDKRRAKKIQNDPDFADREYQKWLAETLTVYEDAMFEGLITTIEDEWTE